LFPYLATEHGPLWNRPLARGDGRQGAKRKFKAYPIGYFHIDIAEVRIAEGKLYLTGAG
jgi:hypothetical protein